ncbi:tyrosine-type recombinase/integrase [Aeoliella sp. SH292]|uniref:tyrosine-type recombinase/integrase n=1 Tax=Aeoliella sp. SH292 TaxID=3454464 RepID=UPI003F967137
MKTAHSPLADPMKILTRKELAAVLADLHRKAPRSKNTRLNRVVFRLAACCGMRVSEIAQLHLGDIVVDLARPHIRVRAGAAKGNRPRVVPLWWDEGTLRDLAAWKEERISQGAAADDQFVGCQNSGRLGSPLSRHTLRKRFRTACKVLGAKRLDRLTIHHGRHTFISHALAGGRTLAEVRDAAGHANVSITSGYLHVAVDDEGVGKLFG